MTPHIYIFLGCLGIKAHTITKGAHLHNGLFNEVPQLLHTYLVRPLLRIIMSLKDLQIAVKRVDIAAAKNPLDDKVLESYVVATEVALFDEKNIPYGLEIGQKAKDYIFGYIKAKSQGGDFKWLEELSQKNKHPYWVIDEYYNVLQLESRFLLDSFMLYVEKDRPRRERFYEPRRKTLKQVTDALQSLENDELDELFVHMPARVGKSQIITLYSAWHCARDTEKSNLYVTYKEGLGGAFLDGVVEILTDPTYCFKDVFPDVKIADTDAKNNKLDLNRKKKYKTLSGKGLESGLNGEYDAYGVLILDDILAGVEDVLSPDVLKRKQTIFDNNVMARAKEKCKKIYNGTIWATNDLYMDRQNFLENDPSADGIRYKIILIPALDPVTDESNFDYDYGVGFSTEHWRRRRAKFEMNNDMAGWFAQCQQQPIDRTGAVFDPEGMRYYANLPGGEPIKVISHVDVALGGADFLSMPIVYYYEEGDDLVGYVEDVVFDNSEKHITQPQVIAMIKKHVIKNLHFEANSGGEGYAEDIQRMLKEDKDYKEICNISTDWALVTKRKEQRIWDNAEEIRKLYFKDPQHRHKQYRAFMNNLFQFSMNMTRKMHDDAPDSLSGLIDFEKHGTGRRQAQIRRSPV